MGAGQPVQFVPEPDNPYDSNAILVKTLAGLELGHVPRELTERFPSELTELFPNQVLLGEVVSIKMAETVDMYGALVRTACICPLSFLILVLVCLKVIRSLVTTACESVSKKMCLLAYSSLV